MVTTGWMRETIFVEIVILHCKDFGVNAVERINNKTAWMEADHKFDRVEDAHHNRITSTEGYSTIHVPTSTKGRDSYRLGRWVRRRELPSQPLTLRYQPVECFRQNHSEGSPMAIYCSSITDRDNETTAENEKPTGLYEYEFQWNMKLSEDELLEKLRQRLNSNDNSLPEICGIGDSHTRLMYFPTLSNLNLKGLFTYVKTPWPSPDQIVDMIAKENCDVFISQVGQWPASFLSRPRPFSFGKYYSQLKEHVQNILTFNPNATIYLPTVDQGPITASVGNLKDWRTPTLLDGYSYVNQMIQKELNTSQVRYVDTNFIIHTHWGGNTDWYHLMEIVRARKTIYMAAIMLGETAWFE